MAKVKAVVVYSGGMDSYTALMLAAAQYGAARVHALTVDYGQRHVKELGAAVAVCDRYGIAHKIADLTALRSLLGGSALTENIAVPEGHYADPTMKQTVVPNRNMILASVAAGYAVSVGSEELWLGVHAGDHAIYPDCRPEFVHAMQAALNVANYNPLRVVTPFLYNNKAEILATGLAMGKDYDDTWTCYNGREKACGTCGSCVERLEAFAANLALDPVLYEVGDAQRPDVQARITMSFVRGQPC